jgi:Domain of unknown function (DUF4350)
VKRLLHRLTALVVALVIIAGLAVYGAASPSDDNDPSSRSAGKLGTLALYTWLQRLGLPVSRLSATFDLGSADVLVEYDPSVTLSSDDVRRIRAFTSAGGEVIVSFGAEGIAAVQPLLQSLSVQLAAPAGAGVATPAQPFDVTGRVRSVPTSAGFALLPSPPLVPLLTQADGVVLGATVIGSGRVFILADTGPLSNDGLRGGDSGSLVLALLERSRGGRVAFDEYHHGEGIGAGGAAAIFEGPIGVAAALAVILVVAFFALNGRRLGRPLGATDVPAPPSSAAYVAAVAQLLSRSRRRGPVAARYAEALKRRIGDITGVNPALDDDAFVAAAARSGNDVAKLSATLRRARSLAAGQPSDAALLALARDIDALERSWRVPAGAHR